MRHVLALVLLAILALAPRALAGEEETTTASGLRVTRLQAGHAGTEPRPGDLVEVHYDGTFPDGTPFDSSRQPGRGPFRFTLGRGEVIPGWDEGVALMTVGSKVRLHVPWALAYGEAGRPPRIPPKSDLVFVVELLSVRRAPPFRAPDPAKQTTTPSGLKVQVLEEGKGEPPRLDQGVTMSFALWNRAGALLVASVLVDRPMAGAVGLLPGMRLGPSNPSFLQEAVRLMKPGGRYLFEVPPELCWGATDIGPELPANSVTIWEFALEGVHDVPAFSLGDEAQRKTTASGLAYEHLRVGTGRTPKATDTVEVHYTGWLTDGTLFDSSHGRGETIAFPLGQVIPGWTEGLQLMKEGGACRLTIPGALAYGKRGSPPLIGPDATLVFLVELVRIQ